MKLLKKKKNPTILLISKTFQYRQPKNTDKKPLLIIKKTNKSGLKIKQKVLI